MNGPLRETENIYLLGDVPSIHYVTRYFFERAGGLRLQRKERGWGALMNMIVNFIDF